MTYIKLSVLLSLISASLIIVMNFYSWYDITYDGKPIAKKWGRVILFICLLFLIVSGMLFFYFVEDKNVLQEPKIEENKFLNNFENNSNNEKLIYNKSTGELYPILPQEFFPHSCVWTIWGDHGSEIKFITDSAFITNETNNETISLLPPRVPIFVTCIDWNNVSYKAKIDPSSD
jgi:hypothetical protein